MLTVQSPTCFPGQRDIARESISFLLQPSTGFELLGYNTLWCVCSSIPGCPSPLRAAGCRFGCRRCGYRQGNQRRADFVVLLRHIKAPAEWARSGKTLCSRHCWYSLLSISREFHEVKCAQRHCGLHRSDTAGATSGEVPKLLPCQYSMNPTRKGLSWLFLGLVLSGGFLQTGARTHQLVPHH